MAMGIGNGEGLRLRCAGHMLDDTTSLIAWRFAYHRDKACRPLGVGVVSPFLGLKGAAAHVLVGPLPHAFGFRGNNDGELIGLQTARPSRLPSAFAIQLVHVEHLTRLQPERADRCVCVTAATNAIPPTVGRDRGHIKRRQGSALTDGSYATANRLANHRGEIRVGTTIEGIAN